MFCGLRGEGKLYDDDDDDLTWAAGHVPFPLQVYKFLGRRTDSKFNATILKRLMMTRKNRTVISVRKIVDEMKGKGDKIAVVVGPVTDDVRTLEMAQGLKVCALRFTEGARSRITSNGGECMTFDQLALKAPKGTGCVLLRGPGKARKQEKHFGKAPGTPRRKGPPSCPQGVQPQAERPQARERSWSQKIARLQELSSSSNLQSFAKLRLDAPCSELRPRPPRRRASDLQRLAATSATCIFVKTC